MLPDLRFAARLLLKDRGFTTTAIVTLAVGIAATGAIFTIVNAILLRDVPIQDADRVVDLGSVSYADLQDWRRNARTFDSIAAFDQRSINLADDDAAAARYTGATVTANTFALIGERPILGRDFREEDERPGAAPVVMLGEDVWRNRYRADPAVGGRTIRVSGDAATVIGVMPRGFRFPENAVVWQTFAVLSAEALANRDAAFLAAFGRLADGASIDEARAELAATVSRLSSDFPTSMPRTPPPVDPFRFGIGLNTPASVVFLFMMGAGTFLLLIACANVANLLLVRGAARAREISVRMAIGATRWQITRQLLAESALLAAAAGVAAVGLSFVSVRAVSQALFQTGALPYWLTFTMDARVFAFLAVACAGTVVVAGLAPAWLVSGTRTIEALNQAGRGHTAGRAQRWTGAFVVGQLALALVLLTGAGLMIRSLVAQVRTSAGVDTSQLVAARVEGSAAGYDTAVERQELYRQIDDRMASIPGVRVSFANAVPLGGSVDSGWKLLTDGAPDATVDRAPDAEWVAIGAMYFETLGARPVRGREFETRDLAAQDVAIVNERFADVHFGGQDPVGRRVRLVKPSSDRPIDDEPWRNIVGVAPNVRQSSREGGAFEPLVYLPLGADPINSTPFVLVRADLDMGAVASLLRREMGTIDRDLALFDIQTVDDLLAIERWEQRFAGTMFSVFAGVAILLAAVGLYGVTTHSVAQRTKEIGIRLALGAQARHIWRLVTRRAGRQLAIGLALGSAGGLAVAQILPSRLAGTSPLEPVTFLSVAAVLIFVGFVASYVPARRAMRVEPVVTLRAD